MTTLTPLTRGIFLQFDQLIHRTGKSMRDAIFCWGMAVERSSQALVSKTNLVFCQSNVTLLYTTP